MTVADTDGTAGLELPSASDPAAWLDRALRLGPGRLFIETAQGRRFTYAALSQLSAGLAEALVRQGVAPGDRVLVRVDKSVEAIALYVACLRMGAVFVPLNTAYTVHELEYFIVDAQPALIVVRPEDFTATAALVPQPAGCGTSAAVAVKSSGRTTIKAGCASTMKYSSSWTV